MLNHIFPWRNRHMLLVVFFLLLAWCSGVVLSYLQLRHVVKEKELNLHETTMKMLSPWLIKGLEDGNISNLETSLLALAPSIGLLEINLKDVQGKKIVAWQAKIQNTHKNNEAFYIEEVLKNSSGQNLGSLAIQWPKPLTVSQNFIVQWGMVAGIWCFFIFLWFFGFGRYWSRIEKAYVDQAFYMTNVSKEITKSKSWLTWWKKQIQEHGEDGSKSIFAVDKMQEILQKILQGNLEVETISNRIIDQGEQAQNHAEQIMNFLKSFDSVYGCLKKFKENLEQMNEHNKELQNIISKSQLLSFNISIEAAHIGEQGRGVALIAEEMAMLSKNGSKVFKESSKFLAEMNNILNDTLIAESNTLELGPKVMQKIMESTQQIIVLIKTFSDKTNLVLQSSEIQQKALSKIKDTLETMLVWQDELKILSRYLESLERNCDLIQ